MRKTENTSNMRQKSKRRGENTENLRCPAAPGFTLIEIVISILIVMTLAAGVMGYQYRSAYDIKRSEIQAAAVRMSMLLLEGWKGTEGADDFDPVSMFESELDIDASAFGPPIPRDGDDMTLTLLDYYVIHIDGVYYYVTLSWNEATSLEPKLLNVTMAWRADHDQGSLQGNEEHVQFSTFCYMGY